MKEYLEYHDQKSHKFWEITVEDNKHTVRYGKIGVEGTQKTKDFADNAKALQDAEKLLASKTKKGYAKPGVSNNIAAEERKSSVVLEQMRDLKPGESVEIKGSAAKPYVIKNVGGVYSCTCPAWRNQSKPIDKRSCKHIIKLRGKALEEQRIGKDDQAFVTVTKKEDGPPLLLAQNWSEDIDVTGWFMSEKLDGVRAYWNGKKFISRQGNEFFAPDWFIKALPDIPLDGELWAGRKQFQKTVSIVRSFDAGEQWQTMQYYIFDAPTQKNSFEERMKYLHDYFANHESPYVSVLNHTVCESNEYMTKELEKVISQGGEGLMLREPGSLYEQGRSSTLLKVKKFYDAEAKVLEHIPGKGKYKGVLGSLRVINEAGIEFSVGTGLSDAERKNPPKLGAVITYRYQELTEADVPRFPSYLRMKTD